MMPSNAFEDMSTRYKYERRHPIFLGREPVTLLSNISKYLSDEV
jgi:hypothetical protein